MSNNQEEFEKDYKESVEREARYIIDGLSMIANKRHYVEDIYIRHVINELNRLNNRN